MKYYNPETKRIDVSDCKNPTAIKNRLREEMTSLQLEVMEHYFGANPDDIVQIGTNQVSVVIAEATDSDGFTHEVCSVITPQIKSWLDTKEGAKNPREAFDRFEARNNWLIEKKNKETNTNGI